MGSGIDMTFDEIAFKCNFAFINDKELVEKRRCDRNFVSWGLPLCDALNNVVVPGFDGKYVMKCQHATEHRCGIKISGPGLSSCITGNDPLKDNLPPVKCVAEDMSDPAAVFTGKLVQAASDEIRRILSEHPINVARKAEGKPYSNFVTLRGASKRISATSFVEKHDLKAFMIAPTAIIRGVGITFGIDLIDVEGTTGYYDSNLNGKADATVKAITSGKYDFGFMHIKAVDDAGHDKNL
eukprot:CAMPEP_0176344172 /NCGR_PEP_ID=MMETSP0126-20121128/4502_1 /TAXON_ID=141414 ORGANISM="Strombidinopsis acuminatum, Strain SPMC142" /NCGR_SAMPLE_ID=MMETSP0126 /ASSEMBLY_ACC=CAM_ASM_000229 /LENGTH=238 /DNA_ID=CAMNT_0017690503 /DNA_START=265 /DNA_END=981 /DNA_ORIENTATION=+